MSEISNPKVYTPKQLAELTSSNSSSEFSYKGLNDVLKNATGFTKELQKLFNDYQGVKDMLNKAQGKVPETPQQANIRTKIEKGIDNGPASNVSIAYRDEEATQEFISFLQGTFDGLDENKTVKEIKEELNNSLDVQNIKLMISTFLRKNTSIYNG